MLETLGYIILGLFVLFVPGFLLTLIFFPKPERFDFWVRVAVSLGLGVMILFYIGVVLARPEWKLLSLAPFTGAVLVLCGFCAVAAYLRGGFAVVATYKRRVMQVIHKPRPPVLPPQPPTQPAEEQLKPTAEQLKPTEEQPKPAEEQPKSTEERKPEGGGSV